MSKPEESSGPPARSVDSANLLGGQRELIILHGDDRYRLRLTASNKLILTK
ncbi:MAG: hemin uptake protein HemP [Enhydrobacter sp.]|nr:MAG: hemin uptake protein HemP [Enhydrobacter sp.]